MSAEARGDRSSAAREYNQAARMRVALARAGGGATAVEHRLEAAGLFVASGDLPSAHKVLSELEADLPTLQPASAAISPRLQELRRQLNRRRQAFEKTWTSLLEKRKKGVLAEADFVKASRDFPGIAGFHYYWARHHADRGNLEKAIRALETGRSLDPTWPGFTGVQMYLCAQLYDRRQAEEAVRTLRQDWLAHAEPSALVELMFALCLLILSTNVTSDDRTRYLTEIYGAAVSAKDVDRGELGPHLRAHAEIVARYAQALLHGVEPTDALIVRAVSHPISATRLPPPRDRKKFEHALFAQANPAEFDLSAA